MIIVLLGPTCTGKSDTALKLAKLYNTEIINGDAFQIYKELNIGVAKPPLEYLKEVPHHLYSFVNVDKPYSIKDYQTDLRNKINEISKRNKNIIIVGGSMLYIRAGLYDYAFNDEKDEVDQSKYDSYTNEELHALLEKIDPEDAKKIHFNNRKRVLRALAIYETSGSSKSEIISKQSHKPIYDCMFFTRDIDRATLYAKINKRVDYMVLNGLIDEVKDLLKDHDKNLQSLQAIGYKEVIEYLDNKLTLDETIELIKKNTRNYAKRQMTFIRHQFEGSYYKNDDELIEIINKQIA